MGIKIAQINLHHSCAASALLSRRMARGNFDIALVQEHWTGHGKIFGLNVKDHKLHYDLTCARSRACIIVCTRLNAVNLIKYLDGDNVAVKATYGDDGHKEEIMFAYLPFVKQEPLSETMKALIENSKSNNKKFIIGCDANAHNVVWGSCDCNKRGDNLLKDILMYDLCLLNKGNEPTFVTSNRKVIDLTICNNSCVDKVMDWKVSDENPLSDHRLIFFSVTGLKRHTFPYRNPRNTNWDAFKEDLKSTIHGLSGKFNSLLDLELSVDQLQRAILRSYYQNCKANVTDSPRLVPWWSSEISDLRSKYRKLFNRAKKNGDWDTYKSILTDYNKAIRDVKYASWRNFCNNIKDVPAMARITKFMTRDRNCDLNILKRTDGSFTELGDNKLALAIFIDIKGAFDRVPVITILRALARRSIDVTIVNWIENLLRYRGYADDVIIVASGKFLDTVNIITRFKVQRKDGVILRVLQ
ncbi:uncharacterized protein LOC129218795 [Uloborus diversus]|uniref:uncharacterized protein LOC129218795 n=1 Tax=Uloborus diversus TaxID=327109 RepID=UPI0024094CBE|nr:uncharacterized protein LOC129218795 [Uloborus diversus]